MMNMAEGVKQKIKSMLIRRQHIRYGKELDEKYMTYHKWALKKEKEMGGQIPDGVKRKEIPELSVEGDGLAGEQVHWEKESGEGADFLLVPYALCTADRLLKIREIPAEYILFYRQGGRVADYAFGLIHGFFKSHPLIAMVYGDEDLEKEDGERMEPWFKPDWSPDTFLSFFYFGSIFAMRKEALDAGLSEMGQSTGVSFGYREMLYALCFQGAEMAGGFLKRQPGTLYEFPIGHVDEVLYHGRKSFPIVEWSGRALPEREKKTGRHGLFGDMISIIIPSKDNLQVLETCITSICVKTKSRERLRYEIIVVDNGSEEKNKRSIEAYLSSVNQKYALTDGGLLGCRYIYEKQEFNFSRMCNRGARMAEGAYLLFLNDDIEVTEPDWLDLLHESASHPYAGAAGIKLLYPDSQVIQHAGITNLRMGPAHKLQYLSDKEEYYFGKNRRVHNMIGVTGACLMVRGELFRRIGGFSEDIAVSFNDVDLCFRIYGEGFYNVVRNDCFLYHHESLSRGKDEEPEKQRRLLQERDLLYERNPGLYARDPFYHKYLTRDILDVNYTNVSRYEGTLDISWSKVVALPGIPGGFKEDECLRVGIENSMSAHQWKYGVDKGGEEHRESGYYIQGYAFVVNGDNGCYKRSILLMSEERVLKISLHNQFRPDIAENLEGQTNTELTGFAARIMEKDIPEGRYRIGVAAEDRCSRQKLYCFSNWYLRV